MSSSITTPASVKAAAIIAIIGGCFGTLGAAAGLLFLAGPYVFFSPALGLSIAFCIGLAVFGFAGGRGLLRMQNSARIAALVFAALIIVLSAALLLAIVMQQVPHRAALVASFVTVDSLPLVISVWWLVLFTRKEIAAQFHAPPRI